MFSALKSIFARRHRRYEWDKLHALGSSRLVQLTVILPVIGYLILFSESLHQHLALYVDVGSDPVEWRLYFLYFGFCALSVGALIFAWQCPEEIKTHGAGFAFVEREKPVYRSNNYRVGELQRTLVGLRLGLIPRGGRLYAPTRGQIESLKQQYERAIAEEGSIGHLPIEQLMLEYFVALKESKRAWRTAARSAYDFGFVLLAVPTLSVFWSVSRSFVSLWSAP